MEAVLDQQDLPANTVIAIITSSNCKREADSSSAMGAWDPDLLRVCSLTPAFIADKSQRRLIKSRKSHLCQPKRTKTVS